MIRVCKNGVILELVPVKQHEHFTVYSVQKDGVHLYNTSYTPSQLYYLRHKKDITLDNLKRRLENNVY